MMKSLVPWPLTSSETPTVTSRSFGNTPPVQSNETFRWLYSGCGFWLIMSPFLLFSSQTISSGAVVAETGTFMTLGMLALVIAAFSYKKHHALQAWTGIALGALLISLPWMINFAFHPVAHWNAWVVGSVIVLTALAQEATQASASK